MDVLKKVILFILIFMDIKASNTLELRDIIVLIISQSNSYHNNLANELKQDIIKQYKNINQVPPVIYLSHVDFNYVGDWTILPLLPRIATLPHGSCVFICTDRTYINVQRLFDTIRKYDFEKDIWFGYGLYDREPTIIHHFALNDESDKFLYPNIASGFVISMPLVKKLSLHFSSETNESSDLDFSIDASHELSTFISSMGSDLSFSHDPAFCVENKMNCATYVKNFVPCDVPVSFDSIYFAVKTCSKFHNDRVPVVKNTWGKYVQNIRYFSDLKDEQIPTTILNLPNTEYGHCAKTMSILKYVLNEAKLKPNMKWVILTDDDTILSPYRLQRLLSCYINNRTDDARSNLVVLGERYGYEVSSNENIGYNYVTGGGGTVLQIELVEKLVQNCHCPKSNSPDDMYIGVCLSRLGIDVTHSPYFHQARPNDYAPEFLIPKDDIISFHKHWMIDPISVYKNWFEKDDLLLLNKPKLTSYEEHRNEL